MKKPVLKVFAVILCALLALGGTGGVVYALSATAEAAAPAASIPTDSDVQATAPKALSSYDPDAEKNVKDETVYVLASADGTVEKIIVSDWVKNALGSDSIDDVSQLTGIENVKGDESFTLGGDNSCVWDARGNDIYYQGEIDKELPVSIAVSYTLDGQSMTPDELAGKSGKVTIRFDYTNNQYEMVSVNGMQEKIYVPFAMLTGVLLDNDVFSNISVSNGKIVNDGDRTIVAGLAFPGLQDSLGLDQGTLDLPGFVEITADAEEFALETTVTLAANGLFNDAADEAGNFDGLDDLDGKRVGLGQKSSSIDGTFTAIFEKMGITPAQIYNDTWAATITALKDGLIDAIVVQSPDPWPSLTELEATNEVSMIQMTDEELAVIKEMYPYYDYSVIQAGTYKANADFEIKTLCQWSVVAASADLSEQAVYDLCEATFSNYDDLALVNNALKLAVPENAAKVPVEWHPGAQRWYEEHNITLQEPIEGLCPQD